ncbi:50S ribosomal protein L11 methyltransferase [Desulfogranum mediterraneum]|uniref:50S ribosomal protein L11 methyltransferase n=1 Tax=Desulfogranum mediterraneum TaxID=160661 RepID=UPI000420A58B|nr:50S ribosomal protein L11 methyltransferase [Desulfogranum mediterraneum]
MAAHSDTQWLKITIQTPTVLSEAAADLMAALSGSGVEQSPEQAEACLISGFFPLSGDSSASEEQQAICRKVATAMEELFGLYEQEMEPMETALLADEDWATSWQQYFAAFEIIPGLVIKPSWEEYQPSGDTRVIEMDPGMAFGTGQHASTHMALQLLARDMADGRSAVLDVGTGTGILAMAGALFGAERVVAIDNDPEAVSVARENVANNQLEQQVQVSQTPLEEIQGSYQLICANIIHDVLVEMAPEFSRLACPGTALVLAGILKGEQEANIAAVYRSHGFSLTETLHQEEWAGMLLHRE